MTVRVLALHAGYRCRHAGACCTSNWPIPIEADRLIPVRSALATGRLQPARGTADAALEVMPGAPAETPALLGRAQSRCVFFDAAAVPGGGSCRVHAALGHDALPLACRQFPRVSVRDPRGVSVTLSHYCPTAAALLDADPPDAPAIIVNTPAFPAGGEYVGLDAREALPPLLRPGLLMDWDAWWECERLAVELFARGGAGAAVGRLRTAVTALRRWSTSDGPLIDHVRETLTRAAVTRPPSTSLHSPQLVDAVFAAIPADIRPARFERTVETPDRALCRFLAAHAFASWTAHLGNGLEVWLRSIQAAAALIDAGAGVRQADLLLRHLAEPGALASALSGRGDPAG